MQASLCVNVFVWLHAQTKEEEILGNVTGSADFQWFITSLGEAIQLSDSRGWYVGGLDTSADANDGKHSIVWRDDCVRMVFHVATLMNTGSTSQPPTDLHLQRKRHIGNDNVVIAFLDADGTSTLV